MPQFDWSRVSTKPHTAPWVALIWAAIGVAQLVMWLLGSGQWMLWAAILWLGAAGVFTATAAGLVPVGRRKPGQTRAEGRRQPRGRENSTRR